MEMILLRLLGAAPVRGSMIMRRVPNSVRVREPGKAPNSEEPWVRRPRWFVDSSLLDAFPVAGFESRVEDFGSK